MRMSRSPLVSHIFTADPSAHVFGGRVYIYPSHDRDEDLPEDDLGNQYGMTDYHVLSQDHPGAPARDHGEALHVKDVPWAKEQMWAPDAAYRNGRYYLYFPAKTREGVFHIGVATAARPEGPFQAEPEPIRGSFSIDPCVFEAGDREFYMVFGGIWGGQLQRWASGRYDPNARERQGDEPALCPKLARLAPDMLQFATPPQDLVIVDAQGQRLKASDNQRRYFEGPWMHRYRDTYYFSYSTGDTHLLAYATSANPTGPFTFRGHFLTPPLGWTTHHSIVEHGGRWWLYYHDASLSGGKSAKRCVKVQELFYENDGSIRLMNP